MLISALDTETADSIIDRRGLSKYTYRTKTSKTVLHEELRETRMRGWDCYIEETVNRACCAAALRDHNGDVQAAISASILLESYCVR